MIRLFLLLGWWVFWLTLTPEDNFADHAGDTVVAMLCLATSILCFVFGIKCFQLAISNNERMREYQDKREHGLIMSASGNQSGVMRG